MEKLQMENEGLRQHNETLMELKDMSNDYGYLPDGWKEVDGNKLCSSCYKERYDVLSGFMKNNLKNS